jgi:ABC-type nickel/cobalt efflux system permease component RcnA
MVILGLLLLIAAIIAAIAAALRGDVSVHVDLEWFTLKTNAGVIFFLGAAAMLVFVLGWWMVARGMRRGRERRREVKALRKRAETSEQVARREHEARVAERANNGVDDGQRPRDADETAGQHAEPSTRER